MHVDRQDVRILELVHGMRLNKVPRGSTGGFCIRHHEGQLEYFRHRKTIRRVACDCPDDVSDAILGLIVKLRGSTAKLHGRVDLALDPVCRLLGQLVTPGHKHPDLDKGGCRQKVVHLERDLLSLDPQSEAGDGRRNECFY